MVVVVAMAMVESQVSSSPVKFARGMYLSTLEYVDLASLRCKLWGPVSIATPLLSHGSTGLSGKTFQFCCRAGLFRVD